MSTDVLDGHVTIIGDHQRWLSIQWINRWEWIQTIINFKGTNCLRMGLVLTLELLCNLDGVFRIQDKDEKQVGRKREKTECMRESLLE